MLFFCRSGDDKNFALPMENVINPLTGDSFAKKYQTILRIYIKRFVLGDLLSFTFVMDG